MKTKPAIHPERIRSDLVKFARIGATPDGGVQRLSFSQQEIAARQLALHLMQTAGLAVRMDGIGNLFGRVEGSDPGLPPIWVGSHIDTVPSGGKFDGSVGVVAALEVVRAIRENPEPLVHPVEAVVFVSEESSRFGLATIGSGVVAGVFRPEEFLELRDAEGYRLGELLACQGFDAETIASARRSPGDVRAFLEVHIEQGRVLETEGLSIGVATAIANATRLRARFIGRADHSGATPMHLRRDALAGAAQLITFVESLCRGTDPPVVGTVGVLRVHPCAMNVIPGWVEIGIDIRSTSGPAKEAVAEQVERRAREIADERGLQAEIELVGRGVPVELGREMVRLLEEVCRSEGYSFRRMPCGAGHDAMQIARIAETGLVLIPCREGISHNPAEWSDPEDIVRGAQVVLEAARRLGRPPTASFGGRRGGAEE
ncbi:MAG: Zn-dependent hydrolase [Candidatus Tectomicrobia bacterium]|nr:Zn-dependent hydrolase [Candidatus Tectomicrobia bacterium]